MTHQLKANLMPGPALPGSSAFYLCDDLETYRYNLERLPEDWIWRSRPVDYYFNQQGYRMMEFENINWDRYIAVFGCSNTVGVGLDQDSLWYTAWAKQNDFHVVNLALAGGTKETTLMNLRDLLNHAPKLPRAVSIQWTEPTRTCMWDRQGNINLASVSNSFDQDLASYYKEYILLGQQIDHEWTEIRKTVQALCRLAGVSLWEYTDMMGYEHTDLEIIYPMSPQVLLPAIRQLQDINGPNLASSPELSAWFNNLARDVTSHVGMQMISRDYTAHPGVQHNTRVSKVWARWANREQLVLG